MQETHRPGHLKQKNKPHKHGRHRSKSEINATTKGKVNIEVISKKCSKQNKKDRRYQASQLRLKKREEALMKKRQIGGPVPPPILVTIVPLGFNPVPEKLLKYVFSANSETDVSCSSENVFHLRVVKMKQRYSFILPPKGSLYATMDALKVSDAVIFLLSATSAPLFDNTTEKLLSIVLAQGLPASNVVMLDLDSVPKNKCHAIKSEAQKHINRWLPNDKILFIDRSEDTMALLRRIGNQKQHQLHNRDNHPYMLAEEVTAIRNDDSSDFMTVKLSGYLRGRPLSVNSIIHIPSWGDFHMLQIDGGHDPHSLQQQQAILETRQIADPNKQTPLTSENVPDPMDAEQTWPTPEELDDADKEIKKTKRVPKGTSDYQACWIPDETNDGVEEDSECESNGMDAVSEADSEEQWEEVEETDDCPPTAEPDKYDATINTQEEVNLLEKIRAAREEAAFPDEIDTPRDIPARKRFEKYRGLASFRTSPWDIKENLPQDYARIYQFENAQRTRRRILKELDEQVDGITPGAYITVYVKNVQKHLIEERCLSDPLVLFGLLPYEHKMSVMNFVLKRSTFSTLSNMPIKSKEPVIIHCGFRRYCSRPIYSQHTNSSKHKYERFFQPDSIVVGTTYAPIMYSPAPVLMFSQTGESLLATGTTLSINPDRLILKRIVLSGHPFRVLKHSAIIRFMFFNREDIAWFKPVELRTKYGRRGHIKEPLGTHGHMKAIFDDQLKSQDTVIMPLYKRVFPPWSYQGSVPKSPTLYKLLSTVQDNSMEC